MGLMNLHEIETVTVEVDGDTYTLRTQISGFERDLINQKAVTMRMPRYKAERGDPNEMVDVVVNQADYNQFAKKIFIKSWSHKAQITAQNLRLMLPHHDDAVMKKIREIMKEQVGESEDSPLVF